MGEVLVNNDSLDQHRVLHLAADLSLDLDQLKVDISPFDIGDRENCVDSDLSHLPVTLVDDLGTQSGHGCQDQVLSFCCNQNEREVLTGGSTEGLFNPTGPNESSLSLNKVYAHFNCMSSATNIKPKKIFSSNSTV